MTLRTRLGLFFVGIVVLPLVAATLAFQMLSARQAETRTNTRLTTAAAAVGALWQERLRLVEAEVGLAANELIDAFDAPNLGAQVTTVREGTTLDFLVVTEGGAIVADSIITPSFRDGLPPPTAEHIAAAEPAIGTLRAQVEVAGERNFVLTGGRWADRVLATDLSEAGGVDVALVGDGSVVAATAPSHPAVDDPVAEGRRSRFVSVGSPGNGILLMAPSEEISVSALWLVAAAGLVAATVLGFALASVIARPLERLAEGARAVAGGDLQTRVEAGGVADVARVAEAFNAMTDNLRAYIGELKSSRDELRHSLDRMGATLRATLDLQGMLEVILDTAAVTLGSTAGALYLRRHNARELTLEAAQGYAPPAGAGLRLEEGVAGVAAGGVPVLIPRDPVTAAEPVEPSASTAIAVPLVRGDRTMGVIALYGRPTPEPFGEGDVETLSSFAAQASVAIENVLLHQETEQLSITDGLTGVWNRRYLELSLRKEIERASRFSRPLSVLMIDIDRFKDVNDRFGHPRGDGVLVEVTRRIMGTIRTQIDFVSRYGGEEFVVVLPETPCDGGKVVAEKIRAAVRDHPFVGDGTHLTITVSVGVSAYPLDGLTAEDIIRAADEAMYRAKRAGRDRVEAQTP
ncbi:MAG TPA: diguanylate cyclase [Actinomycetota bacterium]|nr:diguanylate cyclase [Actinomycetota bacterium]